MNEDLEEKNWKMTCLLLVPNAPEQNPVKDHPITHKSSGRNEGSFGGDDADREGYGVAGGLP